MAIKLAEALDIMVDKEDSLRPFDIEFVSYDESRNSGGELISLKNCKQVGASHNRKSNGTVVVKQIDRDSHPYTVHHHLILKVNDQEIFI